MALWAPGCLKSYITLSLLLCGSLGRPLPPKLGHRAKRLVPDLISSIAITPTFRTKLASSGAITATYGVSFPFEIEFSSDGSAVKMIDAQPPQRTLEKDRAQMLKSVESALNSAGLNGTECVLRAICEAADEPLRHDGMVGEIINLVLRIPKCSDGDMDVNQVETGVVGLKRVNCSQKYESCPYTLFKHYHDLLVDEEPL